MAKVDTATSGNNVNETDMLNNTTGAPEKDVIVVEKKFSVLKFFLITAAVVGAGTGIYFLFKGGSPAAIAAAETVPA